MRTLSLTALLLAVAASAALGQSQFNSATQINWAATAGVGAPTRYCPTIAGVNTISGSAVLQLNTSAGLLPNQAITGTGIQAGSVLLNVNATTMTATMSLPSTGTATGVQASFSSYGMPYTDTASGKQYTCSSLGWVATAGGVLGPALTSNVSIATTTFTTTTLALPPIAAGTTAHGHCAVTWLQQTAVVGVSFGAGMTAVPTNLWVTVDTPTVTPVYVSQVATTPTALVANLQPVDVDAYNSAYFDFVLQTAAVPVTLTLYGSTNNASDALVIEPGSYCSWLP